MSHLIILAGHPRSGKKTAAKLLHGVLGWTVLDKDQLTREMSEELNAAFSGNPYDKQSHLYYEYIRPLEYSLFMQTVWEKFERGEEGVDEEIIQQRMKKADTELDRWRLSNWSEWKKTLRDPDLPEWFSKVDGSKPTTLVPLAV